MTWVRKDDQMPIHRKVAPLTDAAYRLYDEALCWASRNLTDGRIAAAELSTISPRGRVATASSLVRAGLWHDISTACGSSYCPTPGVDGWVIHDYLEYQPSKDAVQRERAAKAERQRRYMDKARRGKDASRDTSADASADVTPSRPAPPRREAGRSPVATARRLAADAGGGREEQPAATSPPTELLNGIRAQLRAASHTARTRGIRREGALDELRALTDPPDQGATE